jgi:dienelactone hydrolase
MTARTDIRFRSGDAECRAWLYLPEASGPSPVVVMAHGLGAIREMRLDAYAERFVAAGLACLVFDYRHFGASGGEPRQLLSVRRQLEDWRAAVAYVRQQPELDPDRIALFGTSFSGGHVISTAAEVPVAAAVAQCPFTDGVASTLVIPPLTAARLTSSALRDLVAARLGRAPVMVPLAGRPGTVALMSAPDVVEGYLGLVPDGVEFRNEVTARAALDVLRYRPGRQAGKVRCPLHVTVCDDDSVAPAEATTKHLARAEHAEVVHRRAGHFDIYTGEEFEEVVSAQVAFLRRALSVVD